MKRPRGRPRMAVTHGTEYAYKKHGCRCGECKASMRRRSREYRARKAGNAPPPPVAEVGQGLAPDVLARRLLHAAAVAIGLTLGHALAPGITREQLVIRRAAALALATLPGWSFAASCRAAGVSIDGVKIEHANLHTTSLRATAHAAALAEAKVIARELAAAPKFTRANVAAMLRREAERAGLSYDDALHRHTPAAVTVRRRVIVALAEMGHTRTQIAKWLGMTRPSVSRIVGGHWPVNVPPRDGRAANGHKRGSGGHATIATA